MPPRYDIPVSSITGGEILVTTHRECTGEMFVNEKQQSSSDDAVAVTEGRLRTAAGTNRSEAVQATRQHLFFFLKIYLAASGLSCGTQDL